MTLLPLYIYRYSLAFVLAGILLTGCVNFNQLNTGNEWDFDHQVQYKKTKLSANIYQIEIVSGNSANFDKLSAFLLRQSYLICGQYGYKLEILKGVESFDHSRASPNLIMPNLTAKLECAINK